MPERADDTGKGPQLYSIAAHRGFADALVAGLIPRYAEGDLGLARLTLLLPSRRAARTVTEAFVRLSGSGLLLPRMVVVGDLDLDETLGPLLDPLGAGAEIPPAADPVRRWLRLAELVTAIEGPQARRGAALLRQAYELGRTIDRLLVEEVAPEDLMGEQVLGIVGEQAGHWIESTRVFMKVQLSWLAELTERGELDGPARRNRLFDHAARRWRETPPDSAVVAAGVTSASPALARLLRVVSELPRGAVILPDLDLSLDREVWDELGVTDRRAEAAAGGSTEAVTHPQYHLKLLLDRMGVHRDEVQPWHRAGLSAAEPARSRAISNLFLPPRPSARWVSLPADQRRLSGVRLMETAHPGEEAQAIAVLIRQALEVAEKRVALVTPDRALAARVVAHLRRWDIAADDTAGQPLPQTAAGRLALLLAEVLAEDAAPVPLVALLTHPLVHDGESRADWLDHARRLDLVLRGPRPGPGLAPLRRLAAEHRLAEWWGEVETVLAPLLGCEEERALAELLDLLAGAAEALCGEAIWSGPDGRALAGFVEELREAAREAGTRLDPRELHAVLRDAMERVSVRPPWGGHPRVAIYGLLEARMTRADLVICGGMTEGVWPASPMPDALLPPAVLRALGVPGADFRIGLAAHDLAGALGAPEVVLSHAQRDAAGPVLPSRFVLRIKAMLGTRLAEEHRESEAVRLARLIDDVAPAGPYPRPKPMPSAEQRRVDISVTGLDRLRSDPYQFYAGSILRLRMLDPLDAEPSAAWKGTAVHEILDRWHKAGGEPEALLPTAEAVLDEMSAHPLMRSLWRPRLVAALAWVGAEIDRLQGEGRRFLVSEADGEMRIGDIRIHGRADRIDRLGDGGLAVVDYKTGKPPSPKMVKEGYSLQLGLIGMIAARGGFAGVAGAPTEFEYWSLAKDPKRREENGFGYRLAPFRTERRDGLAKEDFLAVTESYLRSAIDRWILGEDPFTARLNPDIGGYNDFDQLMRLDEWLPHLTAEEADEA